MTLTNCILGVLGETRVRCFYTCGSGSNRGHEIAYVAFVKLRVIVRALQLLLHIRRIVLFLTRRSLKSERVKNNFFHGVGRLTPLTLRALPTAIGAQDRPVGYLSVIEEQLAAKVCVLVCISALGGPGTLVHRTQVDPICSHLLIVEV